MWCIKCNHDVVECQCSDIEERLKSLYDSGMGLAARQNLDARTTMWDEDTIYENAS